MEWQGAKDPLWYRLMNSNMLWAWGTIILVWIAGSLGMGLWAGVTWRLIVLGFGVTN